MWYKGVIRHGGQATTMLNKEPFAGTIKNGEIVIVNI